MAQLVEPSLPTPEIEGSNPVIGNIYMYYLLYWKDENKEKRGREDTTVNNKEDRVAKYVCY